MLANAKLPPSFWGEATTTTCFFINRCPSAALEFKTPMEIWSGKPVDYQTLRVFGCTTYIHVNEEKLNPRSKKSVFLGYPEGTKGYNVCISGGGIGKAVINRDILFHGDSILKETPEINETKHETCSYDVVRLWWIHSLNPTSLHNSLP